MFFFSHRPLQKSWGKSANPMDSLNELISQDGGTVFRPGAVSVRFLRRRNGPATSHGRAPQVSRKVEVGTASTLSRCSGAFRDQLISLIFHWFSLIRLSRWCPQSPRGPRFKTKESCSDRTTEGGGSHFDFVGGRDGRSENHTPT